MLDHSIKNKMKSIESFYLKKDYKSAIVEMTSLGGKIDQGIYNYNLGSLYLKNQEFGLGRYYLEKALKSNFVNGLEYNNLKVAKDNVRGNGLSNSENWQDQYLDFLLDTPSTTYLSGSIVIAIVSLFVMRKKLIVSIASLVKSVFIISAPFFIYLFVNNIQDAIVLKDSTVYEGPSKIYKENSKLSKGSKIILGKRNGNWFFIKNPKSISGWIEKDRLGILD